MAAELVSGVQDFLFNHKKTRLLSLSPSWEGASSADETERRHRKLSVLPVHLSS